MAAERMKPATVSPPVAHGMATGTPSLKGYEKVKDKSYPRVPMGGRMQISVAELEKLLGRVFIADEIYEMQARWSDWNKAHPKKKPLTLCSVQPEAR